MFEIRLITEAAEVVRENLTLVEIGKGFIITFLLAQFQSPSASELAGRQRRKPVWSSELLSIGGYFGLFLLSRSWLALVNHYVPDSYLDEVFHVPQAQTYFEGRYFDWDAKITTPPGLYLLSLAYHKLYMLADSSISNLRSLNLLATLQTTLLVAVCRNMIEANAAARQGRKDAQSFSFYTYHTALNVTLFPVLFFFSSLYYTDVFSTLLVLLSYQNHLARVSRESGSFVNDVWTVVLGVGALLMRQTNVFWVVVYMGGLEAVHALRSLNPPPAAAKTPRFGSVSELLRFYVGRYSVGCIHDPPLNLSWPDDWFSCTASLTIAVACNPVKVLRQVWPHIMVLALFAGFVVWNGGVVLGDKSNHVVTIHFAQMLYIWPFFAFFSAPLLVAPIANSALQQVCRRSAPSPSPVTKKQEPETTTTAKDGPRTPETADSITSFVANKRYYPLYLLGTVLLSLAVVRFNTVIHPFTLADNRHYMFYVFRYTILRPGFTRYFLVVAYLASRWLVWNRLAGYSPPPGTIPPADATKNARAQGKGEDNDTKEKERPEAGNEKKKQEQQQQQQQQQQPPTAPPPAFSFGGLEEPISTSAFSPPTSTVLLWLLATALSLVTAPLVEPRYFILPWVFWRLLVPAWPVHGVGERSGDQKKGFSAWLLALGRRVDLTLVLETLWFLAINVGVMYVFLFRPFYWRSETGELLDGGRVQRFMW